MSNNYINEINNVNKKTLIDFKNNQTLNYNISKPKSRKSGLDKLSNINNATNKIIDVLKRQNSFFEDDPNYLHDYILKNDLNNNKIEVDNNFNNRLSSNVFDVNNFINLNNLEREQFNKPKLNDNLFDYKQNLGKIVLLKNKLKNNAYLIRHESKRVNNYKQEESSSNSDKKFHKYNKAKILISDEEADNKNNIKIRLDNDKILYGESLSKLNEDKNLKDFLNLAKKHMEMDYIKRNEKNLKLMDVYSKQEINDYYNYKIKTNLLASKINKEDKTLKEIQFKKENLLEKAKNKTAFLNNHVMLFKPCIYKSKKQQHYEMTKNQTPGENVDAILQKNTKYYLKENEIKNKLDNYEKKIREIEQKNYMEKLEKLDDLKINFNLQKNIINKNINKDSCLSNDDKKYNNNEFKNYTNFKDTAYGDNARKYTNTQYVNTNNDSFENYKDKNIEAKLNLRKISLCQKIINFFIGDAVTSYSTKKRVWGGENKAFDDYFQDKRTFGNDYQEEVIGEKSKKANNKSKANIINTGLSKKDHLKLINKLKNVNVINNNNDNVIDNDNDVNKNIDNEMNNSNNYINNNSIIIENKNFLNNKIDINSILKNDNKN